MQTPLDIAFRNKQYDKIGGLLHHLPRSETSVDEIMSSPIDQKTALSIMGRLRDHADRASAAYNYINGYDDYNTGESRHIDPETLHSLWESTNKHGNQVTGENIATAVSQEIESHPNFVHQDPEAKSAADFWTDYEKKVKGSHFAKVASHHAGGTPVSFTDHRGDQGHSDEHAVVTSAGLDKHAQENQRAILKDESIEKKYIKGEPHVLVHRGVSGDYAAMIKKAAGFNESTGEVASKTLKLPNAAFSSWSLNKEIARPFASRSQNDFESPLSDHGLIISKWMPLKNVLHSGFHSVTPQQEHAHPREEELVFHHKDEPHLKVKTSEISEVLKPKEQRTSSDSENFTVPQVKVKEKKPKPEPAP